MKIFVLGGTGFIGRHLCEKLVRAGYGVTVATRKIEHARSIQTLPGLDLVACNVHDQAALARAVQGHDAVINLVAILHGSEAQFEQVHVQLPRSLVAACQSARIRRVVHVSSLAASMDAPSRYLRSKGRGEQVLAESGLSVSVVRPSVVFGPEDRLLNTFADLQRAFPLVPLACAEAQFQPVWVEDVAQALVKLLDGHRLVGAMRSVSGAGVNAVRVFEAAGPDILSLRDLVSLAGRCVGVRRPIFALPAVLGRLQATVMEYLPGPTLMSRDNIDSMKVASVATGRYPGLKDLAIEVSSIEAIAAAYLSARAQGVHLRERPALSSSRPS